MTVEVFYQNTILGYCACIMRYFILNDFATLSALSELELE